MHKIYSIYKKQVFPKLVAVIYQGGDPVVSQEDKRKIRALLEKPWNPYLVHRHSTLKHLGREKGLCDSLFEQLVGWKPGTNMKQKYVHLHDDESAKAVLKLRGVDLTTPLLNHTNSERH